MGPPPQYINNIQIQNTNVNCISYFTQTQKLHKKVISSLLGLLVSKELYLWDHYTDTMQVQHGENMNTNANICSL